LVQPTSKTLWATHFDTNLLSVLPPRTCQLLLNLVLWCRSSSFWVFLAFAGSLELFSYRVTEGVTGAVLPADADSHGCEPLRTHKGRPQKFGDFYPLPLSAFVRIWLTPLLCGRPHLHTSSTSNTKKLCFERGTSQIFISN